MIGLQSLLARREQPDETSLLSVDVLSNVQAASQAAEKTALEKAAKGPQPSAVIKINPDGTQTMEYSGPVKDPAKTVVNARNDPYAAWAQNVLTPLAEESAAVYGSMPSASDLSGLTPEQMLSELGVQRPGYSMAKGLFPYLDERQAYNQALADPAKIQRALAAKRLKDRADVVKTGQSAIDELQDIDSRDQSERRLVLDEKRYKDDETKRKVGLLSSLFGATNIERFESYDDLKATFERMNGEPFDDTMDAIAQEQYYLEKAEAAKEKTKAFRDDKRFEWARNAEIRAQAREARAETSATEQDVPSVPSANNYLARVSPDTLIKYAEEGRKNAPETIDLAIAQWQNSLEAIEDEERVNEAAIAEYSRSDKGAAPLYRNQEKDLATYVAKRPSFERRKNDLQTKIDKLLKYQEAVNAPAGSVVDDEDVALQVLKNRRK